MTNKNHIAYWAEWPKIRLAYPNKVIKVFAEMWSMDISKD